MKIDKNLRILVATLTRRRPEMLTDLLTSWLDMSLPDGCEVNLLVVENDDQKNSENLVLSFQKANGSPRVLYAHEPEPGIPFARNCALQRARLDNMDLLCFIDDDEVVTKDWLVELVQEYRKSGASLIGGPARLKRPQYPLSTSAEAMFEALKVENSRHEQHWAKKASNSDYSHMTIGSYNWMLDLNAECGKSLRFDETLRWSGGSDAQFCADIKSAGGAISWAPNAIVYETFPAERLTSYYTLNTARERYKTYIERKLRENMFNSIYIAILLPFKLLGILIALPLSIFNKRVWIKTLRACGWIWAVADVVFLKPSRLYEETTGY